ncbi:MAG: hypothetical protein R2748_08720 [Bryobacterales bacterium]
MKALTIAAVLALLAAAAFGQQPSEPEPNPEPGVETPQEIAEPDPEPEPDNDQRRRTELNLLGRTNTAGGESRRNENVQFNLVDNNALKELNARVGVTATIVKEFDAERGYFGAEFGNPPSAPIHVRFDPADAWHGRLRFAHQNSIFSARSFFQVGDVQPAHENDYGGALSGPLWSGAHFTVDGGQKKIRGQVNGNVLVPMPEERTPLATDPEIRALVQRYLSAYPAELPNRTDINARALNTNSPQRINDDNALGRIDQALGSKDKLYLQYAFTAQQVDAFQLVAGQNPDADIKSHRANITWNRSWSPSTISDLTASFDRLGTFLRPEENAVGPLISTAGLTALGPGGVIPLDRSLNTFRYAGRLQQSRGRHNWKSGFELLRRQLNGRETDVHRGFFSFGNNFGYDAITNLRLGLPTQHIVSIGDVHRGYRNWMALLYAEDRWNLSSKWTLDFGLSLGLAPPPNEVNGRDQIDYHCDCNNWSPRFGFARRLDGRWGVLRGAYGLTYGQIFPVTYQQVRLAPRATARSSSRTRTSSTRSPASTAQTPTSALPPTCWPQTWSRPTRTSTTSAGNSSPCATGASSSATSAAVRKSSCSCPTPIADSPWPASHRRARRSTSAAPSTDWPTFATFTTARWAITTPRALRSSRLSLAG